MKLCFQSFNLFSSFYEHMFFLWVILMGDFFNVIQPADYFTWSDNYSVIAGFCTVK